MITEQQINNLYKLPKEDILVILDNCIEVLGLVDIETAQEALYISRSRIYQIMNDKNSYSIGKHKFPCINLIK